MAGGDTWRRSSLFHCACVVPMAGGVSRFRSRQRAYSPRDGKGYLPSASGARHTHCVANGRCLLYRDASAHGAVHGQETDNGRQSCRDLFLSLPPAIWSLPVGLGNCWTGGAALVMGRLPLARAARPGRWSARERPKSRRRAALMRREWVWHVTPFRALERAGRRSRLTW